MCCWFLSLFFIHRETKRQRFVQLTGTFICELICLFTFGTTLYLNVYFLQEISGFYCIFPRLFTDAAVNLVIQAKVGKFLGLTNSIIDIFLLNKKVTEICVVDKKHSDSIKHCVTKIL